MEDDIFFSNIVTKSLDPVNSEDRFFEGYLTVEVKDKQGEITVVDELYKVLPVWMDRGAPISDTHSNRIIGKGINFSRATYKSGGQEIPAIKITGKIHKNYELDNEIWSKIKSGEYKGLSFGGATKSNRTPKVMKDGSVAYQLTDLEHYEVAVCKDPAVPLALITDFNPVAKAMADHTEDRDGKMVIKCSKFGCVVDKAEEKKKEPKLTEGGRRVLQEATTVADLYKVDLSGIETFEGKVEALMDEGKSRESAEKIVGSFTKKNDYPYLHDGNDDTCAHCGGDLTCAHCGEYHGGGHHHEIPHTKEDMKDSMEMEVYENHPELEEGDVFGKPKPKKKDAPTGHDPTQVAHSPDTPREMELEKGKDLSNTAGDTSSMYNQNGAEQRVNSKKAEPNVQQGVAGGEVPPQWTGSGSPYPEDREKKVIKRRKLIKNESWYDLKDKAFELDMQWKVVDLVKDALDNKERLRAARATPQEENQTFGGQAQNAREFIHTDYHDSPEEYRDVSERERKTRPRVNSSDDFDKLESAQETRLSELFSEQARTPPTGKAPKDIKRKALIEIAEKLKGGTGGRKRSRGEKFTFGRGGGYGTAGDWHSLEVKPSTSSEEQFHRDSAKLGKIPTQNKNESDQDYQQRVEAYVHEKTHPQNMSKEKLQHFISQALKALWVLKGL